jgi:hypothetical protein
MLQEVCTANKNAELRYTWTRVRRIQRSKVTLNVL